MTNVDILSQFMSSMATIENQTGVMKKTQSSEERAKCSFPRSMKNQEDCKQTDG